MNKLIGELNTKVFKIFGSIPLVVAVGCDVYFVLSGNIQGLLRPDMWVLLLVGGFLCGYESHLNFESDGFNIFYKLYGVVIKKTNLSYATTFFVESNYSPNSFAGGGGRGGRSFYSLYIRDKYKNFGWDVSRFFSEKYYLNKKGSFDLFMEKANEISVLSNCPIVYAENIKELHDVKK